MKHLLQFFKSKIFSSSKQIQKLDEELTSVKAALLSREESLANLESKATQLEDNNHQLEEKVVELMAEISDREAEHIARYPEGDFLFCPMIHFVLIKCEIIQVLFRHQYSFLFL